jgi:hypothetical protein
MSDITKRNTGDITKPDTSRAAAFLDALKAKAKTPGGRGRLIFALDATASRGPTWRQAVILQGEMFDEVAAIGGLDGQLAFYRGGECKHSQWKSSARDLAAAMEKIRCMSGNTQIGKILRHTLDETKETKVSALVFVGDAFEESLDELAGSAKELGRLGVRAFMFQEGDDSEATEAFQKIARLTGGGHHCFAPGAAHELGELLRAVATYAVGGKDALRLSGTASATKLLGQLK